MRSSWRKNCTVWAPAGRREPRRNSGAFTVLATRSEGVLQVCDRLMSRRADGHDARNEVYEANGILAQAMLVVDELAVRVRNGRWVRVPDERFVTAI